MPPEKRCDIITEMFPFLSLFRRYDCASVTDAGLVRSDNQDSVYVDDSRHVFCVADGLGGGEDGALASRIVCREVGLCQTDGMALAEVAGVYDEALRRANARIRQVAEREGYGTMGSTVAMLVFNPDDPSQVAIGHVGDSRVYRRRGLKLKQMTADHRKSAYSHILTRAVGMMETLEVEWTQATVEKGDAWLVCTDGVHDMLPEATLNGIFSRGGDASAVAERISEAVRRAGARDNFTFCVIRT